MSIFPWPASRGPSRRIRATLALSTFLTPLIASNALAQQVIAEPRGAADLPTITVSATGSATPLEQIASSVTVITAEEIEREQRRTLPSVLQRVPGLDVVQSGGPGSITSVFIRGTNANHVKVLIDGIDVSDPSNPNRSFDFGQLLTDDLARVEVLRGPQSGLYGADAIGGVISITTKKGEGPPKVTLKSEAGSYGTWNQFGTLSGSNSDFNYLFSVQHFRSDKTPVTPPELVPLGRRINPNLYDNASFSTRLGYDFSEAFSLNYVARLIDSRLLSTTDSGFPSLPNEFRSRQDDTYFFQRGEAVMTFLDGRFRNVFGASHSNLQTVTQGPPDGFLQAPATSAFGYRTKFDYRGDFLLTEGQRLVFGAEHEEESLNTKDLRASNGNKAAYVQMQQEFFKRFFLVSNFRVDDNDRFGPATTYRVAPAVILPGIETKLKASVGTGFKSPTLNQLFVDFPLFGFFANPNLLPEKSFGWDAGLEQPLNGDRVRFGLTYFENEIKNLIQINDTFTSSENIGRASTYGVESFVKFAFSEELNAQISYTNTSTRDEIRKQELLRRPRHKVATTVDYRLWDRLTLSTTMIFVGSRVDGNRDFSIPRLKTGPYALVNVAASYAATDKLSVFARIDNLFDRRIEDPTGFLRPGFSAFAGMKVTN